MCSRGQASGSGSSATRGCSAAPKEKRQQSGEDSDESIQQPKKRKELNKDPSAAEATREEMASLLVEIEAPKKPATTLCAPGRAHPPASARTPASPRQPASVRAPARQERPSASGQTHITFRDIGLLFTACY